MAVYSVLDSQEVQKDFLTGLIFLAKADGVIDKQKVRYIDNASIALGLKAEKMESFWEMKECPALKFRTREQKNRFLMAGIELCYLDGRYDPTEKKMIHQFAQEIDIDEKLVEVFEVWVECHLQLKKYEGESLIFG